MSTTAYLIVAEHMSKNDMRDIFGGMNHGNWDAHLKATSKLMRGRGGSYEFPEDDTVGWRGIAQDVLLSCPYFCATKEEIQRVEIWLMLQMDPDWSSRPFKGVEAWAENREYGDDFLELIHWLNLHEGQWMFFTVR